MPRGRPRKEILDKVMKDVKLNGRVSEGIVPLDNRAKVPTHGAYKGLTPEKADKIGSIVKSGIEELKISTSREKVHKGDLDEIVKRTFEYLERKQAEQRLPSVEGLAAWFGISRKCLTAWLRDDKDKQVYDFLNNAREAFSAMWTEASQTGNINPVSWIFYAKNHYGYVDKQEIDISAKTNTEDLQDEDSIRKRWLLENGKDVGENDE